MVVQRNAHEIRIGKRSGCPSCLTLDQAKLGELATDLAGHVDAHLVQCPICSGHLQAVHHTFTALDQGTLVSRLVQACGRHSPPQFTMLHPGRSTK